MPIDLHDAEAQRSGFDLIPNGTVVPVYMHIRPGAAGEGGWATLSKAGDSHYLNCEFIVTGGPYKNRKFWGNLTVQFTQMNQEGKWEVVPAGGKVDEKGNLIAWNITKSTMRAMVNSAKNIKPEDDSGMARAAHQIKNWGDLDGIEFLAKVKIKKEKPDSGYQDKNELGQVIEPGHKDYGPISDAPAPAPAAPAPAWAAKPVEAQPALAAVQHAAAGSAPASSVPAWAR